jgi:hypothetical protein
MLSTSTIKYLFDENAYLASAKLGLDHMALTSVEWDLECSSTSSIEREMTSPAEPSVLHRLIARIEKFE